MRTIVAFVVIAATVVMGGCFHHREQVYTAELPPVNNPPFK